MKHRQVLVVGLQQQVVNEFSEAISQYSGGWEIYHVETGKLALDRLADHDIDIILCEAQLPDMDGIQFFEQVCRRWPGIRRIVLASPENKNILSKGMGIIHQFIAWPGKPSTIAGVLLNSARLWDVLSNDKLQAKIASIRSIPSPPKIYNQLTQEIQSEKTSIRRIADLIKEDIGITARLLQMANSPFFGLRTDIKDPMQAINVLGLSTIRSMVLSAGIFTQFSGAEHAGFSIDELYNRGVSIGSKARLLATALGLDPGMIEDALVSGMMHDIGKLILLKYFPDELEEIVKRVDHCSPLLPQVEREVLGVSDAEIGAYLLSLWGLNDAIVEAVAWHYEPHKAPHPVLNVLTATHLAFAMHDDEENKVKEKELSAVDKEYVTGLGLWEHLADLSGLAMAAM